MRSGPPLRSSDYGRRGQPGRPSAGLSASELICRRIPGRRATEYKPSGSIRLQSSAHAPALPLGCEGEFRVREGGSRSAEEPPCRALGQVSDSRALEVGEGSHADVDLGEVLTEVGAEAVRGEGPLVAPVMGGVSAV